MNPIDIHNNFSIGYADLEANGMEIEDGIRYSLYKKLSWAIEELIEEGIGYDMEDACLIQD